MQSKNYVIYVHKNTKNNTNCPRGIRIFGDQTQQQKDYIKMKQRLEEFISNGVNRKTMKYINNAPTFVNKNENNKN